MAKVAKENEIEIFIEKSNVISENAKNYFKKKLAYGLENNNKKIYISDDSQSLLVAIINQEDYDNSFNLIDNKSAYLIYFSQNSNNIIEKHFLDLLNFAEKDLKAYGFNKLTIGIEISAPQDLMTVFKAGFTQFIKYSFRPLKSQNDYINNILVAYYSKDI